MVCVSTDLGAIAKRLGATGNKIHVVRNGVDTSVFRYRERSAICNRLSIPKRSRLLLYVGCLTPTKGVTNLVDALAILTSGADDTWMLALAGKGHLEEELRRRATGRRIADKVRFLGALDRNQVAEWMNAADVLCLPSESEGCPNVVLEALSCGCPVVATAVGGVPELVGEPTGLLTSSNRPEVLAEAIQRACCIPWDRPANARRARRGWDDVARETYEICQRVRLEAVAA
jgi:glycosyltransferase involved in cell wall biosynthesis